MQLARATLPEDRLEECEQGMSRWDQQLVYMLGRVTGVRERVEVHVLHACKGAQLTRSSRRMADEVVELCVAGVCERGCNECDAGKPAGWYKGMWVVSR
jgi:hypothetical protein